MPGRPLPACRRRRPRWVRISARPLASRPPWPSGCTKPWAPRMSVISWLPLLRPTRLRASASTTPLPRPPPGSLPVWVGSPLTGRVSHPLDDKQSFMMSSHHHSPLTSLAWSHRAPTPPNGRRIPGPVWVDDFIEQLAAFPMGAHDDDVDAFTQLLLRWRRRPGVSSGEIIRRMLVHGGGEPFRRPR